MSQIINALHYASRGWPILPLHNPTQDGECSCQKTNCSSVGKHPRISGGFHKSSTNQDLIQNWWATWPRANIGIATGQKSKLLVIDIDDRKQGFESWINWSQNKDIHTDLIALSGNGKHLYFQLSEDEMFKSCVNLLPGVDVRADGGFIVAPGSLHFSGRFYKWEVEGSPAPLPDVLKGLLKADPLQTTLSKSSKSHSLAQGQRNTFLIKLSGFLKRCHLQEEDLSHIVKSANTICSPSLEESEVQSILKSISRYEQHWETPRPLRETFFKLPDLKTSQIPKLIQEWSWDASERMQVPPESFVAPLLCSFGALVGQKARIFPKQQDQSWFEVGNLWGALVARSGFFKSPIMSESLSFLNQLALEEHKHYEEQKRTHQIKITQIKAQMQGLEQAIIKATIKNQHQEMIDSFEARLLSCDQKLQSLSSSLKQFIVNDSTVEKLAVIFKENPNGFLLYRDELSGWALQLNKREGDRQFFLETWSGKNSFKVDRIGRGRLSVPSMCLSIFGSFQPSKFHLFQGDSDGLLQRFQLLIYPQLSKSWRNIDRPAHVKTQSRMKELFDLTKKLETAFPEAKNGLYFSSDAQDFFQNWRQNLEIELRSGNIESEGFESHLAKYRTLIPKLSLLFHLITALSEKTCPEKISFTSLHQAIEFSCLLRSHAEKLYKEEFSPILKGTQILAQKIKENVIQDGDSIRSVYRRAWSWLESKEKVEKSLGKLEELGWLKLEPSQHNSQNLLIRLNPQIQEEKELR
jgi:hypothetical protein